MARTVGMRGPTGPPPVTFPGVSDELAAKAALNAARLPESVRNLMFALMATPDDAGLAACLSDEIAAYANFPATFQSRGAIAGALEDVRELEDLVPILAALSEGAELPPQIVYVSDRLSMGEMERISAQFSRSGGGRLTVLIPMDDPLRPEELFTSRLLPHVPRFVPATGA